jgi:hypothetical protein
MIRALSIGLARHLRHNVIAYLALLLALGGTSYAAADRLLPRNSVGSAQVINGSLQKADLSAKAARLLHGARGAKGAPGPRGGQGPQGAPGQQGATGPAGSPDTAAQVLTKVEQLDGAASGLDADVLDGHDSSEFQQACTAGAVAGYVYVKGSATFSATYTSGSSVPRMFNCSGGSTAAQVKRTGAGTYLVDFPGLPVGSNLLVASGNVTVDSGGVQRSDMLSYKFVFDAGLGRTVAQVETASGAGTLEDREFSFVLLG